MQHLRGTFRACFSRRTRTQRFEVLYQRTGIEEGEKIVKMAKYIGFLRGINVGGHKLIKMDDLREIFLSMGLSNVWTYIQSGNVVFTCEDSLTVSGAVKKIEKSVLEKFGYNVSVMIRTVADLKNIILLNPFVQEENFDPSKMVAILLYERSTETQIQKMKGIDYPPDKFQIIDREVFVYCPNGFGRSKLYTNFSEKKMGVVGTARNWKTITTLLGIAEKR